MISLAIATLCLLAHQSNFSTTIKQEQVQCQKYFVNCLNTKMQQNNWTVISKPNSYSDSLLLECMKEQK